MSKKSSKSPYPTQPSYPVQQPNPPMLERTMPGMPAPPPSYNEALTHPIYGQHHTASAPPYNYGAQPQGYPSPYAQPYVPYQYQPVPTQQLPATVVVPHAFDAGCRFDGISQPRVPPPPPGIAPNLAQQAAQGGHTVVLGQKPDSWLAGGSSGGTTFW